MQIQEGYRPGILAEVVGAHIAYYAPAWGFGLPFEIKVASEMAALLGRYDPARDLILSATDGSGAFADSITIDGEYGHGTVGAHLRWFIVTEKARGTGLGRQLLERATGFADACGYRMTYLTTFPGLDAARHLYQAAGFRLVAETGEDAWSGSVGEQRFERLRT